MLFSTSLALMTESVELLALGRGRVCWSGDETEAKSDSEEEDEDGVSDGEKRDEDEEE